jgi:hypothetical protein
VDLAGTELGRQMSESNSIQVMKHVTYESCHAQRQVLHGRTLPAPLALRVRQIVDYNVNA